MLISFLLKLNFMTVDYDRVNEMRMIGTSVRKNEGCLLDDDDMQADMKIEAFKSRKGHLIYILKANVATENLDKVKVSHGKIENVVKLLRIKRETRLKSHRFNV